MVAQWQQLVLELSAPNADNEPTLAETVWQYGAVFNFNCNYGTRAKRVCRLSHGCSWRAS
jgi:hypothetical protein